MSAEAGPFDDPRRCFGSGKLGTDIANKMRKFFRARCKMKPTMTLYEGARSTGGPRSWQLVVDVLVGALVFVPVDPPVASLVMEGWQVRFGASQAIGSLFWSEVKKMLLTESLGDCQWSKVANLAAKCALFPRHEQEICNPFFSLDLRKSCLLLACASFALTLDTLGAARLPHPIQHHFCAARNAINFHIQAIFSSPASCR